MPFHARWRHFVLGGRDLWGERAAQTAWASPAAKARAEFDLAIASVLLDAGAGPSWRYRDPATEQVVARSEGLGVASLRMFEAGAFSADPADPLRADAERLVHLKPDDIAHGLQSMVGNRLVGLEGRAALLASLGAAVAANPEVFAREDRARPGGLFDYLAAQAEDGRLAARRASCEACSTISAPIWPGRLTLGGVPLGDTWRHPAIRRGDATDGLVPIHKLSQWLSYSLIEPLQWAGIAVTDIDGLTGLAEYRNGGLFVDAGVLRLRDPEEAIHPNPVDSRAGGRMARADGGAARRDRVAGPRAAWAHHRRFSARARARRRHLGGGAAARAREAPRRRPAACGRQRRHGILSS